MKLKDYLSDKKYLILLYIFTSSFTGIIIRIAETVSLRNSDGLYTVEVSLLLFVIYLTVDYLVQKKHYNKLMQFSREDGLDWVNSLPRPLDVGQRAYNELLQNLYKAANYKLEEFSVKSHDDIEFITMWVHEIKTPIAATKLIIENSLDAPTEKILYDIEDEIGRIEDYVQMALYYERSDNFSRDYLITSVNIEKVVTECVKREYSNIAGKNLKLHIENLACDLDTDEKWLGFITKQILDNAVKYSQSGGNIRISMEQREQEAVLNIEDDGEGIREEDLKRVFDKSFTGFNGRKFVSSTGIGLFLAQKLARKLGHFITIESELKHGTKVSLHFPKWNDFPDLK